MNIATDLSVSDKTTVHCTVERIIMISDEKHEWGRVRWPLPTMYAEYAEYLSLWRSDPLGWKISIADRYHTAMKQYR